MASNEPLAKKASSGPPIIIPSNDPRTTMASAIPPIPRASSGPPTAMAFNEPPITISSNELLTTMALNKASTIKASSEPPDIMASNEHIYDHLTTMALSEPPNTIPWNEHPTTMTLNDQSITVPSNEHPINTVSVDSGTPSKKRRRNEPSPGRKRSPGAKRQRLYDPVREAARGENEEIKIKNEEQEADLAQSSRSSSGPLLPGEDEVLPSIESPPSVGYPPSNRSTPRIEQSEQSTPKPELTIRSQLIGAWKLVSYSLALASNPYDIVYPMGSSAQGWLIYTPCGHVSSQMLCPGQERLLPGDPMDQAPESYWADMGKKFIAFSGKFWVDETGNNDRLGAKARVYHEMCVSNIPALVGHVQKRTVEVLRVGEVLMRLGTRAPGDVYGKQRKMDIVYRKLGDNLEAMPKAEGSTRDI